jgi:molybdenum cofactor cytidylyltransferase
MGRFKLTMPWDSGTVISQVVTTLERAGVGAIIVVIGHRSSEVISALDGTRARTVFNPSYANGEMFGSLQTGLRALLQGRPAPGHADGLGDEHEPGIRSDLQPPPLLLCLGDQPQMQVATVRTVLAAGEANGRQRIIIPSFEGRAGHPILLPAWIWSEILASTGTLRDVLSVHRGHTHYLPVDTPTVLADLDTPEDYARED